MNRIVIPVNHIIKRSKKTPIRKNLLWKELWRDDDKGMIACWESGRRLRDKNPELASRSENHEFPILTWKGGVKSKTKKGYKYGTLHYLAQWQGLRDEDLNIDMFVEYELYCSETGMKIIFTYDARKYNSADMEKDDN